MGVTICWAVKGGSGTTVTVAGIGAGAAGPTLLIDLDGDLPAVLGSNDAVRPGFTDWLDSAADPPALDDLAIDVGPKLTLIRRGDADLDPDSDRWADAITHLTDRPGHVVIDGGLHPPAALLAAAEHSWLVTRACSLAIHRAAASHHRMTGVIVVAEAGRVITSGDIARSLAVPVVGTVPIDPAIAAAVDTGGLPCPLPRHLRRPLRRLAA